MLDELYKCNTCNIDKIKEMMQSKILCKRCFSKTVYIKSPHKIKNDIKYINFREKDGEYYVTRIFTGKEYLVSDLVDKLKEIIERWDIGISIYEKNLKELLSLKELYLNKKKNKG